MCWHNDFRLLLVPIVCRTARIKHALFRIYFAPVCCCVFNMPPMAKRGCFKRGGFPIWTCPSFFVLFCPFWDFPDFFGIFPICPGTLRGFSRFVLFLFLGLLTAPTRNSPERVRDTIWTLQKKPRRKPRQDRHDKSCQHPCAKRHADFSMRQQDTKEYLNQRGT